MQIGYNKTIPIVTNAKSFGLIIDNTLPWKNCIALLINSLNTSYYVIRSVKPYVSQRTLTAVYCALFNAVMTCGII
jgi:hypothetical protein